LVFHLTVNFSSLLSPDLFQEAVNLIHILGPALWIAEWTGIFLPMLFHGIVGLWIVSEGRSNTSNYPYRNNVRYTLQRVTGVIAFVYIIYHVAHMHHYGAYLNSLFGEGVGGQFIPEEYAASSAAAAIAPLWVKIVYILGMGATVFHLANGVWTFGITWGLWISPAAQKRADYIALGLGLALFGLGVGAIVGLSDPELVKEGQQHAREHWAHEAAEQQAEESETPASGGSESDTPAPVESTSAEAAQ
jgi:succinate dehydrogenase / fumarate reductase cytochrome b subunit